jgi:hypothetical protein
MALQLTATKGPAARWLQACTARATSSLPVPDSPRTSTGAMLRGHLDDARLDGRMTADSPTSFFRMQRRASAAGAGASGSGAMPVSGAAPGLGARCGTAAADGLAPCTAEATTLRNCLRSTGLVR